MDQKPGNFYYVCLIEYFLHCHTQAYDELLSFIKLLNDAVVGKKVGDEFETSPVGLEVVVCDDYCPLLF